MTKFTSNVRYFLPVVIFTKKKQHVLFYGRSKKKDAFCIILSAVTHGVNENHQSWQLIIVFPDNTIFIDSH